MKRLHITDTFAWTVVDVPEDTQCPVHIHFGHGEHARQLLGTLRLTEQDAIKMTDDIRAVVFSRRSARR